MLVDEIPDELGCVLVLELVIRHTNGVEPTFDLRVHLINIESLFRIPSNMADMLETRRQGYISFCEFLSSSFISFIFLLVLLARAGSM